MVLGETERQRGKRARETQRQARERAICFRAVVEQTEGPQMRRW